MLDIGGAALFLGGLVVLLIGISWGGVIYPWKSGHVIGMIVGGFGILVVFVLYGKIVTVQSNVEKTRQSSHINIRQRSTLSKKTSSFQCASS